ncbi:hypothetical protein WQ54_30025 [Bacillus sp. SA1-12]|uniref:DUF1798 family protein n=1 Tax=Bacillus sp. SA1-12 TaxID=1455638 RepID=UPI00062734B2|nr:DUF1798 family protein [Bacillus sp. SA1-12]KKI88749.1 hypothetical protein WQ54_30025 [Bacillus sp. SA1-12]
MNLFMLSNELLQLINDCKERFEGLEKKPEKTEEYFFTKVKPAFEFGMNKAKLWESLAEAWVKEQKPKYIHLTQIESAIEHIEQIILQSFYNDINNQRFHNLYNSIEYILKSILSEEQTIS